MSRRYDEPSNQRQMAARSRRTNQAPLRKIVERSGSCYTTVEVLECGHTHRPKMHPVYPERHLEAKSRRCQECAAEEEEA